MFLKQKENYDAGSRDVPMKFSSNSEKNFVRIANAARPVVRSIHLNKTGNHLTGLDVINVKILYDGEIATTNGN